MSYDRPLFAVTLALLMFGLVMVFSASAVVSSERYHSPYAFVLRQLVGAALGFGLMLLVMRVDYRRLRSPAVVYPALFVTIFLLALVFFLDRAHHTHRWIRFGPLSFQPSELAKPTFILFLAFFLEPRLKQIAGNAPAADRWRELWVLRPALLYLCVVAGLVFFEPDLGTTLALLAIAGSMFYIAGLRLRYFGYSLAALALPLYFAVFHVTYRRERILSFINPWNDAQGRSFQIVQSLIAVGTGGLTGLGVMNGHQKLFFLPEPQTDFIFAVVSEELGLLGAALLIGLFIVFLVRGVRIAAAAPDGFGRLLATGITAMVVIQALINFSVVTGLMPTKGIPLPLISYGGSSLVVTLLAIGVLLNISQHA